MSSSPIQDRAFSRLTQIALHCAAISEIDEGEAPVERSDRPCGSTLRVLKHDDAIGIGVAPGHVNQGDVLAIEVHGDIVIESDNRQRRTRRVAGYQPTAARSHAR